jgi:hypothetical protein
MLAARTLRDNNALQYASNCSIKNPMFKVFLMSEAMEMLSKIICMFCLTVRWIVCGRTKIFCGLTILPLSRLQTASMMYE